MNVTAYVQEVISDGAKYNKNCPKKKLEQRNLRVPEGSSFREGV